MSCVWLKVPGSVASVVLVWCFCFGLLSNLSQLILVGLGVRFLLLRSVIKLLAESCSCLIVCFQEQQHAPG